MKHPTYVTPAPGNKRVTGARRYGTHASSTCGAKRMVESAALLVDNMIIKTMGFKHPLSINLLMINDITQIMYRNYCIGVTVRQTKRLVKKYKQYDPKGLISKQRGLPGDRKYTEDTFFMIK